MQAETVESPQKLRRHCGGDRPARCDEPSPALISRDPPDLPSQAHCVGALFGAFFSRAAQPNGAAAPRVPDKRMGALWVRPHIWIAWILCPLICSTTDRDDYKNS